MAEDHAQAGEGGHPAQYPPGKGTGDFGACNRRPASLGQVARQGPIGQWTTTSATCSIWPGRSDTRLGSPADCDAGPFSLGTLNIADATQSGGYVQSECHGWAMMRSDDVPSLGVQWGCKQPTLNDATALHAQRICLGIVASVLRIGYPKQMAWPCIGR